MSYKKAVLIFNPDSGRGNGSRQADDFGNLWRQKTSKPLRFHPTRSLEDLRDAVKKNLSDDQILIFMGGDGTLSEGIQALVEKNNFQPCVSPVGFLPGGTGNSFLRDFGIKDYKTARDRLISDIETDSTVAVDAGIIIYNKYQNESPRIPGELTKRITLNIWGVGLISEITALAEKLKGLGAYCYTFAAVLKIITNKSISLKAKMDGSEQNLNCAMITVSNSRFTGGNMEIAPAIRVCDGKLYLICVQAMSRLNLLRFLPKVIKGKPIQNPLVQTQFIKTLELVHEFPLLMNIDGELVMGFNPRLSIQPAFFKLYANREMLQLSEHD